MNQEFDHRGAVKQIHENLGGSATKLAIAEAYKKKYPKEYGARTLPAFAQSLGPILTSRDAFGLPRAASFPQEAPKVDPDLLPGSPEELEAKQQCGVYVMRDLWDADDYKATIRKYYGRARSNDALAEKLAAEASQRWANTVFTPSVLWEDGPDDADDAGDDE